MQIDIHTINKIIPRHMQIELYVLTCPGPPPYPPSGSCITVHKQQDSYQTLREENTT